MRRAFLVCLTAALIAAALPGTMTAQTSPQLSLDFLFGEDDPHGESVRPLAWHPEEPRFLARWDDGDGDAWWLFDAGTGEKTLLAKPEDFGVEKARKASGFTWTPDGKALLLRVKGDLMLFDVESRKLRRLTGKEENDEEKDEEKAEEKDEAKDEENPPIVPLRGNDEENDETPGRPEAPGFSPDSAKLAYVRSDELYVLDVARGEQRRLTHDGEPDVIFNGTTDWVYWEEIWGRSAKAYWWSADSRRIAFYHFDDTEVPVYTLINTQPLYPDDKRQRYPKSGETLPTVEIRVLDLESGETVKLATGEDPDVYLVRVDWHPDDRHVAVQRLNRDQTRLDVLLCSVEDGTCEVLTTKEWPTWVNLTKDFTFLEDGRFLWSDESTGWRRLYLYDADGRNRRALTGEGWSVESLLEVNEAEGWFVVQAFPTGSTLGAAERHILLGDLAGGAARLLTEEAGTHSANVSPTGYFVHRFSNLTTPSRQTIRSVRDASVAHEMPSRPPQYDVSRLPRWEHLTIPGPDGQKLPAAILKPLDFDPSREYPVLMYHYGCPGSQVVSNAWPRGGRGFWHLMMAERGYVVLSVDNAGSQFFGKHGEDKMHRLFGAHELAAQLAGVEYLRRQPWADTERLGLWGWSGGGYSTIYSVLNAPGVWRAAMSGAPVTDWRYYDAIWTERYLDRPQDNEEGYKASSALESVDKLSDALLMIHGTGDDNVHPQNTFNAVSKFIEAGKPVEMGIYPNMKHGMSTLEGAERHVLGRMTEFFDRHLKPGPVLQPVPVTPDG